jgi:predicted nucleotidyltransferase
MGSPPLRVDLMRQIDGVRDFRSAFERSVTIRWGGLPVRVISLDDLISAKRAAGRAKDRRDLRALEKARDGRR